MWQCGFLPSLLRSWQIVQPANLAELAYGNFEVSDPLGWDFGYLEASVCVVEQFGGSIYLTGSDLTQGQLSN